MNLPKEAVKIDSIRSLIFISLAIWAFTSISYALLSWMIPSLQSASAMMAYCGIVCFVLGALAVVLLSDFKFEVNLKALLRITGNALLIYFSVNGIQAFYAAIQSPSNSQVQEAELVPFLSARPWLPPAGISKDLTSTRSMASFMMQENDRLNASLDSTAYLLKSCGLMTDSIFLTVIPQSREIASGGVYRSDVVLAAKLDKSYVKKVSVNQREVPLQNGVAVFEESSKTGGTRNLNYEAEIELYGESQTITTSDSYRVIRPYLEVSSQAVNSLYLNCGNKLSIMSPVHGSDYKPRFEVSGGYFRYGKEVGSATIVPTAREVTISVYNQNVKIGDKVFPVRKVPAPSVKPYVNGREIDPNAGISKSTASLGLGVVPDADFSRMLPGDASYKVQECEISLISRGVFKSKVKGTATTNLASLIRNARPGDQLKVDIRSVLRKNFKGDVERVSNYHPKFFLIPIN